MWRVICDVEILNDPMCEWMVVKDKYAASCIELHLYYDKINYLYWTLKCRMLLVIVLQQEDAPNKLSQKHNQSIDKNQITKAALW
jgi:hypothetical protein